MKLMIAFILSLVWSHNSLALSPNHFVNFVEQSSIDYIEGEVSFTARVFNQSGNNSLPCSIEFRSMGGNQLLINTVSEININGEIREQAWSKVFQQSEIRVSNDALINYDRQEIGAFKVFLGRHVDMWLNTQVEITYHPGFGILAVEMNSLAQKVWCEFPQENLEILRYGPID